MADVKLRMKRMQVLWFGCKVLQQDYVPRITTFNIKKIIGGWQIIQNEALILITSNSMEEFVLYMIHML